MSGWRQLIEAAAAPTRALLAAARDPEAAQLALLRCILTQNGETEFGRAHGFSRLATVADYRAAVPIAGYEDFQPFIERIAAGEPAVLIDDPVVAFEETGGTASGGKLVPYTAANLAGFRAAILPWLADLARRRPDVSAGCAYVSISPVTREPRRTVGGIPVGLASDAAFLGADLAHAFVSILAVPPDVAAIRDVGEWRIATLAHLVERDDLSFVSVWSPTFFLELIAALPAAADLVAPRLSPPAAARLAKAMRHQRFDATVLWPRLDTISCWADGSSTIFARRLAALCPQAAIEPKGLFATEAAITLPWRGRTGAIPALTSTFLEFIDDGGSPRLAHEVRAGASYRVVITTPGGLYRYDMSDQVRCVGHDGLVPRLTFEGRAALVSDLVGEKLTEAFVAGIVAGLPIAVALVPAAGPKPHYEVWLDDIDGRPEEIAASIDAALRANPQYAYARDVGQLGAVVGIARPGFVARRHEVLAAAGGRMGDFKHTSLLLSR